MGKLRLCHVKDEYIAYLRKFDESVMKNKPAGKRRPYIGVVVELNSFRYYIPLTSPKDKHKTMKNSIDFLKINEGKHGAMNINNMIPINKNQIIHCDIDQETDEAYKRILQNQAKFIKNNTEKIINNSKKLYEKVVIKQEKHFIQKCSNFKLLELKCTEYTE